MPATARLAAVRAAFERDYGAAAQAACDAPGRVNLIGEHIDYAGGSVLPFAIQLGVSVAAAWDGASQAPQPAGDPLLLGCAPDGPARPDSGQLAVARRLASEVLARLYALGRRRWPGPSGDPQWRFSVYADLPPGGGLSSSAAFTVALAGAAAQVLYGAGGIDPLQLCQLCREAETAATGVQCGLMDQYAAVFGQAGCAVLFDSAALTHELIPLALPDASLALLDSGQPRTLAASGYNARRAELAAGQPDRLRHVATEKARVAAACTALRDGDPAELGRLLNASQASLRDDYAVSTPQLDLLCELLEASRLAWGARLTGAGFGGNVLALLRPAALEPDQVQDCPLNTVLNDYAQRSGLTPTLRRVWPCAGAAVSAGPGGSRLLAAPAGPGGQP